MNTLKLNQFFSAFVVVFFIYLISANCQTTNKIDSLLHILDKVKEDQNKIKTLILISREYTKTDPAIALAYANQSLEKSSKLDYKKGIIDAILLKSNILTLTGSFDSAKIYSKKAISLSNSIHDDKRIADSYVQYASIMLRIDGPFDTASYYYLRSHAIYKKIGDSAGYLNSLNGLGINYRRLADYDSAVYYFLEYIKLSEKLKDQEGLGKGYVNLGIAYYELKDFNLAKFYLKESIKINEKLNALRFLSLANNNLGSVAMDENNLAEALYYYNLSLEQCQKANYTIGIANAHNNLGNIYEKKKEYDKALEYYKTAKKIYEKVNYIDGFIASFKNIALISERRGDYDNALKMYDSCLVLAKNSNLPTRIIEILYNMHKTYELTGNYKEAYRIQINQVILEDSIFNVMKEETISRLQIKYDKEKDLARIMVLENENLSKSLDLRRRTNQRNIYFLTGTGTILIILFVFLFYQNKARKDKIIAQQKIRQLEDEKKLLAARSIVDGQEEERKRIANELHDGLGVLLSTAKIQFSAIKDKNPENQPLIDKATKLIEQAAGDVRKISHNMMPGLLTRFGLFEAVEDLFENLNDGDAMSAELRFNGAPCRLAENQEIMLYRIVQEMVNNSLKHAEASKVFLGFDVMAKMLKVNYSDNGKGFDPEKIRISKSLGLTSIHSRVKFLGGELAIDAHPGLGVKYSFEIPITKLNVN